jgi:hypothetical protein
MERDAIASKRSGPVTSGEEGAEVPGYEPPRITELGTFLELTQGNQNAKKADGSATSKNI